MKWMKTSLTEIVQQKQKTKKQLSNLKNRYIAIIYGGISKQQDIKAIHKRLYDETISQKKLGKATSAKLLNVAFSYATSLKNKSSNLVFVQGQVSAKYGESAIANIAGMLGAFAFDLIKNKKLEKNMSHVIVKEADRIEAENKDKVIDNSLDNNRKKSNGETDPSKIMLFYLASSHKDSASDHRDWQGKIYIDEKWENVIMPKEIHDAIDYYVKSRGIKTMQWVIGKPVWFITRPNCRHYFKEISVQDALNNSAKNLIKKYDMESAIGDRQYLQTIKHSTSKEWYDDVRNAELLLQSYRERLEMHQMMYSENPCPQLKAAIEKDKMLIRKWEEYIANKKGK